MSEPTPRAPGSHSTDASADDALAAMNDHLARFFQHADTLLRDWQAYGDKLRRSIDGEVGQIGDKVARAVAEVGRNAATQLDSRVEQGVADSLASLRRELDNLARLASQTGARSPRPGQHSGSSGTTAVVGPPRRTWSSPVFWALVVANILLVVLLVASVRDCQARDQVRSGAGLASDPAGASAPERTTPAAASREAAQVGDAGSGEVSPPASDPAVTPGDVDVAKMCETLASGYDPAAAEMLLGAALGATCGEQSDAVENVLFERLASEPGEDTAKDSKEPSKSRSKKSSKSGSKKSSEKSPKKSADRASKRASSKEPKKASGKDRGKRARNGSKSSKAGDSKGQ